MPGQVAVIGPGTYAEPALLAAAREVGRLLAEAGAVVVTGGLGGVMAAACAGAREAGGRTVGLLPGLDRGSANPDVDIVIPTGLGQGRNVLVVRSADAVVVVGGSWGTLSEVAHAVRGGVPVVAVHGWQVRDEDGRPVGGVRLAASPAEAVRLALDLARQP